MRINGFDQLKAFYSWVFDNANKAIKPQHISLYVFLLNQNNRNHWVEWFKIPYDLAMQGACIGNKKTYYNCLNDLQKWGLIKYQKGVNEWKAPSIKLEVLNRTSNVPQSTTLDIPLPTPQGTPLVTQSNKRITGNVKPEKKCIYNIYSNELFKNRNKKYANQYLLFIKTLYGKVGHHGRMNNVLKLEQQCTYDSFVNVYMKALDKGKKLLSIIMAMDNKKDLTKRYKSVSKTALNWLDQ